MSSTPPASSASRRRPRGYLSAQAILDGAFELAEKHTAGALSMPKLAKHMGVGVTSLYWYYRSKDNLIDAMATEAARRYLALLPDLPDQPWDQHLRSYFRGMKEIFQENPVICDLLAFRGAAPGRGPEELFFDRIDHEVTLLLDAGFEGATAASAYQAMSVFTLGVVQRQRLFDLAQQNREADGEDDERAWRLELAPGKTFPGLEQTMAHWSRSFASDREFEAGMSYLIDGLRTHLSP